MISDLNKFSLAETSRILTPLYEFIERSARIQQARTTLELFFSGSHQEPTPEALAERVKWLVRGVAGVAGDPGALDDLLEKVTEEILAQNGGTTVASADSMTLEEIDALAFRTGEAATMTRKA